MKIHRIFTFAILVSAIFLSVATQAATHRNKRDRRIPDGMRPKISEETRKLAMTCRTNPSEENRAALKKQIGIDYDRYLEDLRAKIKDGKHDHRKSQEARRRLEALTRDREKHIAQIMLKILDPQARPDDSRPPKSPKHHHRN